MAKLDWEKARQRDAGRRGKRIKPPPAKRRRSPGTGITNDQAKLLGQLCRQHGIPYTGQGMTRAQASTTILGLQKTLPGWQAPMANNRAARRAARAKRRSLPPKYGKHP